MTTVLDAVDTANSVAVELDRLELRLRRFRSRELGHRQLPSRGQIIIDAASRVLPWICGYAGATLLPFPYDMIAAAVLGIATVSLLGSWFHDGVHGHARGFFGTTLMRMGSSPVGFSPRWWQLKHIRLHHRFPGNPAFDPDIQFHYVARVSAEQPWRRVHAIQHLHMWFLYPLATLNVLKPEEPRLVRRYSRRLGLANVPRGWILLADKYLPFAVIWTPVWLAHPGWSGLRTFLAFEFVVGVLSALVTQVQHNTALSYVTGDYASRWPLCDQLLRTSDVGRTRGVWWWMCGGTNFHVVHHLAPSLTFLELAAVSARLRADLNEFGVTLPAHAGLWAAVRSHAAHLRNLSRPQPGAAPHQLAPRWASGQE